MMLRLAPTIAAISGFCLAGGLELALWCDLRIAAEGSTLGYPERRWGVPLIDGGTQRLPRIVGLGRALDLILTGRMIGAEEALAIGLLNEVVEPGAHLERALALAEGLARFPQRTSVFDYHAEPARDEPRMTKSMGHNRTTTFDRRTPGRRLLPRIAQSNTTYNIHHPRTFVRSDAAATHPPRPRPPFISLTLSSPFR